MFSELKTSSLYRTTAFLLSIGIAILLLILGQSIFIPLAFAAFIAIILAPLCQYLENQGIHRNIAAFLCTLLGGAFVAGIVTFFALQISALAENVDTFEDNLNQMTVNISAYLGEYLGQSELGQLSSFNELFTFLMKDAQSAIGTLLVLVATSLITILFLSVFVVLFLMYRKDIRDFGVYLFEENGSSMRRLLLKIEKVVRNYLVGIFQVILILAVCNSIALWILGVPNALFFGIFSALLNVVPFIGPMVGSIIPAMFTVVINNSALAGVWVILYFTVIQTIESYLITPSIVGNKVRINPMFTLLAIFIGNLIWGIPGMILFIPLTAVLKQIFDEVSGLRPYASLLGELDRKKFIDEVQEVTTSSSGS
ncbi:AI-2E family transporter [Tunicatimonas pelagia]|uniref:AI-2E family transporter n=1 Tax=Tunicatimonas pelagia TaxID=931531 RepID=UPI0026650475|nr:AI-2E family transporter [Tunicatimonas pelagia]WKN43256.1 AI-2E family transporter [Tunicatimonas pelagia]